jgi:cyclohexyl-isocyanide hydratase
MADQPRVVFPLYDGSTLLDFAGATQIFSFAGLQTVWAAPTLDPITTTENVQVVPGCTFDDAGTAGTIDVLFVPGGGSKVADVMLDPKQTYVNFLKSAAPGAQYAGSVCTGAFLLGTAGLLDGYEATTYWSQRENLALFPNVRVAAGYPRWVIHGQRFTGGGISSSIDLALELVNLISGPTQSMSTQLGTQYAPDPPFSSGDPAQAPPEVTEAARKSQGDFIATIRLAVEKVVGEGES